MKNNLTLKIAKPIGVGIIGQACWLLALVYGGSIAFAIYMSLLSISAFIMTVSALGIAFTVSRDKLIEIIERNNDKSLDNGNWIYFARTYNKRTSTIWAYAASLVSLSGGIIAGIITGSVWPTILCFIVAFSYFYLIQTHDKVAQEEFGEKAERIMSDWKH